MKIGVGDKVRVWKWAYDREYSTTGIVEKVQPSNTRGDQSIYVNGDWYGNANDLENKCEIIKRAETSYPRWMQDTAKQYGVSAERVYDENMNFLQSEGYFERGNFSRECQTFDEWMRCCTGKQMHRTTEPFQKGDLGYGL
jgi:hypothetical protein